MADDYIINREAVSKTKGFRLQKIRLIELILREIEKKDNAHVYGAIELLEDINLDSSESNKSETYLEENKNYNKESTFTINSSEVLNTLVIFCDIWSNKWRFDNKLKFGFYSTNSIGKENVTEFIKSNNLKLPNKPVLELLSNCAVIDSSTLELIKYLLINEYNNQYGIKNPNRVELVKKIENSKWNEFFKLIDWKFGEEDDKTLKEKVIEDIKNCRYFSSEHQGKELNIFSELMEIVEERQFLMNPTERFVYKSDVENIFLKVQMNLNTERGDDPVWKQWKNLEPSETRNIKEKIIAICKTYSQKKIGLKSLVAARGHCDKREYEKDKSFMSLRYRVYEIAMKKIVSLNIEGEYTDIEVESFFNEILGDAIEEIKKLRISYKYSRYSDDIIEGILHELFDSCFLSLDK